jgi:hypothetical protein
MVRVSGERMEMTEYLQAVSTSFDRSAKRYSSITRTIYRGATTIQKSQGQVFERTEHGKIDDPWSRGIHRCSTSLDDGQAGVAS